MPKRVVRIQQDLLKHPQSLVPQTVTSPESVALILKRGVGNSTLPWYALVQHCSFGFEEI